MDIHSVEGNNTVTIYGQSYSRMTKAFGMALILFHAALAIAGEASVKPNIVIILADDMGYGDCTSYNPESKIPTPHIDQLAREGVRFTDAHSASGTCTPSRYGLLTGVNPARTGVRNTLLKNGKPIIDKGETTIATLLKDQGYTTRMVGKWHLGFEMELSGKRPTFDFSKPLIGGPLDRGFDDFFGIHSSPGAAPYFYIQGRHAVAEPTGTTSGVPGKTAKTETWAKGNIAPGYDHWDVAPRLCREAVRIIRDHATSKSEKPLFLYYALSSPHAPWLPTEEFIGKSGAGAYGDFIVQMDSEVGQVQKALKETGLDQNTLLIFTSDNGPGPPAIKETEKFGHRAAGVLRGYKAMAFEGGHRVPFIAKWPGRIQPASVTETTINFSDVFATLAELVGVDGQKTVPGVMRDSHSFLTSLLQPEKRVPRPPMVNTPDCIRIDDWKLISKKRGRGPSENDMSCFDLYNLADDISEEKDLSGTNPEQVKCLFGQYKAFIRERRLK